MQRWALAKLELAKKHGTAKSGAGRAMGYVGEDRNMRPPTLQEIPPPKPRSVEAFGRVIKSVTPAKRIVNGTVVCLKAVDKLPRKLRAKHEAVRGN